MAIVCIKQDDDSLARKYAKNAELGGHSNVRRSGEREAALSMDQYVGQLGTVALHQWLYGHVKFYARMREEQDTTPWKGDGGSDVAGFPIDVKSSLVRSENKLLYDHNLVVRPRERHAGVVYVLCLVQIVADQFPVAYLLGWAGESRLPDKPEGDGVFKGAFLIKARDLALLPVGTTAQRLRIMGLRKAGGK